MKKLTTTSYAILGLLSVRPWSAYELAGQMRRGIGVIWPRAERALYDEPKNLVALGLAKAAAESTGRRGRTVYSITAKGRKALAAWLAEPPSEPPQLEAEALVRLAFATAGTKDDLLRALASMQSYGEGLLERMKAVSAGYVAGEGPFPEREHLIALMGPFLIEWSKLLVRYAEWAQAEVRAWPAVSRARSARDVGAILERLATGTGLPVGQTASSATTGRWSAARKSSTRQVSTKTSRDVST